MEMGYLCWFDLERKEGVKGGDQREDHVGSEEKGSIKDRKEGVNGESCAYNIHVYAKINKYYI